MQFYNEQDALKPISNKLFIVFIVISIAVCSFGIFDCVYAVGIDQYLYNISNPSKLYEQYYIDPSNIKYSFPEQKEI